MVDDLFEPVAVIPNITQALMDKAVVNNPDFARGFVWTAIKQEYRAQVNARWLRVRQFCEQNFVTEFRNKDKFYSKLWELNLRYLLVDQLTRKPGNGEPDLIADKFVIECVVPASTDVPDMVFDGRLYNYPTDEIGRRVTAALVPKLVQFEKRVSKVNPRIGYADTPYIIAVGLPQREYREAMSMSGMDIVEAIAIGAGPLRLSIKGDGAPGTLGISSRDTMSTRNGTELPIGYFRRDEWKGVSAVLWSSEWLPEISDVKILLNPNANIPLSLVTLGVSVGIITYTKTESGYRRDQPLEQI